MAIHVSSAASSSGGGHTPQRRGHCLRLRYEKASDLVRHLICRALPEGISDALADRVAMGIAISRRERTETPSFAADEYGEGHREEPWV